MFAQTINLHITRVFADQILGALTNRPAAALLDAPLNVHLYTLRTNPIGISPLPADFTECTYDGYAEVPVTVPNTVVQVPNGLGDGNPANALFVSAGISTPENAMGYYLTDGGDTVLYGWEDFPTPIPMGVVLGDFLDLNFFVAIAYLMAVQ